MKEELDGVRPSLWGVATPAVLVAEGDHACRWLAHQPRVHTRRATADASGPRYVRVTTPVSGWPQTYVDDGNVAPRLATAYNAWSNLCDDVRQRQLWTPRPGEDD